MTCFGGERAAGGRSSEQNFGGLGVIGLPIANPVFHHLQSAHTRWDDALHCTALPREIRMMGMQMWFQPIFMSTFCDEFEKAQRSCLQPSFPAAVVDPPVLAERGGPFSWQLPDRESERARREHRQKMDSGCACLIKR